MGGLRAVGVHPLRPPRRATARRRPRPVDLRRPRHHARRAGQADHRLSGRRARRRADPGVQGRRAGHPRHPAADRRALPAGVHRRAHPHARLPRGRRAARRPHPDRRARSRGPRPPRTAAGSAAATNSSELYGFLAPDDKTVVYCRIGERSSHTWFVLTHLLGLPAVRNYDGSWTEWGNAVRVPVAVGEEPGEAP